jgi:mRNA interferase RelE/StbE
MNYQIAFKPRSLKDLSRLREADQRRAMARIEGLQDNLAGDVKRLTNFTPEYRLRVGDYRVLFEVEGAVVVVYRLLHRKDAYR